MPDVVINRNPPLLTKGGQTVRKGSFCSRVFVPTLLFWAAAADTLPARDRIAVKIGKKAELIGEG
jgi:hypothetical protein